jgi:ribosomal protein S21
VFANEPPLDTRDIDQALRNLKRAAQEAARDLAEKQRKEAEQKEREEKAANDAKSGQAAQKPKGSDQNSKDPATGEGGKGSTQAKQAEQTPSWVYWAVAGVVVITMAGITWYFVRRKLYSHDIEQRYALYLSTLSYQQLRAKHKGDIDLANADLDQHLSFVRGDLARAGSIAGKKPFYSSVVNLPVRLQIRPDPMFVAYLKDKGTFL